MEAPSGPVLFFPLGRAKSGLMILRTLDEELVRAATEATETTVAMTDDETILRYVSLET